MDWLFHRQYCILGMLLFFFLLTRQPLLRALTIFFGLVHLAKHGRGTNGIFAMCIYCFGSFRHPYQPPRWLCFFGQRTFALVGKVSTCRYKLDQPRGGTHIRQHMVLSQRDELPGAIQERCTPCHVTYRNSTRLVDDQAKDWSCAMETFGVVYVNSDTFISTQLSFFEFCYRENRVFSIAI